MTSHEKVYHTKWRVRERSSPLLKTWRGDCPCHTILPLAHPKLNFNKAKIYIYGMCDLVGGWVSHMIQDIFTLDTRSITLIIGQLISRTNIHLCPVSERRRTVQGQGTFCENATFVVYTLIRAHHHSHSVIINFIILYLVYVSKERQYAH